MRLLTLASSALLGAFAGALLPVVAVLSLKPVEYGSFSTIYLIFAYGISLQYSIVSEAWARARGKHRKSANWSSYSAALITLAIALGLLATFAALIFTETRTTACWLGPAVCFSVYRSGARYHRMALGLIRRVIWADLLAIILFVVVFLLMMHESNRVAAVAIAWLASGCIGFIVLGLPVLLRGYGPVRWWKAHRREIIPLLTDSTLMDLGAIGAPFLLVGFMGPGNFGLYRGVANAAMPVRLLLDPLRPAIGHRPSSFFFRRRVLWALTFAALGIAAVCYVTLAVVVPRLPVQLGTLSELVDFSHQAAIFTAASFVGTLFYVVCRNNATKKTIMLGRFCQTTLVLVMPIGGYMLAGLEGAVWGFSLSATISGLIWLFLARPEDAARRRIETSKDNSERDPQIQPE